MRLSRRAFLLLQAAAVAASCRRPARRSAQGLTDAERTSLGALAETLVPADETPGAEAGWAARFVERRLAARPDLAVWYRTVAREVDAAARRRDGRSFAALPPRERETLLRGLFPTIAHDPTLDEVGAALRAVLRELARGFFAADLLDIDDLAYTIYRAPARDVTQPSPPAYDRAMSIPDHLSERENALMLGAAAYRRAWTAAGYEAQRGLCKTEAEIATAPSWRNAASGPQEGPPLGLPPTHGTSEGEP